MPARTRTRDFRLTPEQADALRPAGWRRLLAPLAGPRFAFAAPLGGSLAALGIAGILVAGAALHPDRERDRGAPARVVARGGVSTRRREPRGPGAIRPDRPARPAGRGLRGSRRAQPGIVDTGPAARVAPGGGDTTVSSKEVSEPSDAPGTDGSAPIAITPSGGQPPAPAILDLLLLQPASCSSGCASAAAGLGRAPEGTGTPVRSSGALTCRTCPTTATTTRS